MLTDSPLSSLTLPSPHRCLPSLSPIAISCCLLLSPIAVPPTTIPTLDPHYSGAMTTITFGDKQAVTMKTNMAEVDLSRKQLGASGAIIVAAFLPKCR